METRDFDSTEPRDKFFALLLLFEDAAKEGLVADYTLSTAQVFTTVATNLLKTDLIFFPQFRLPRLLTVCLRGFWTGVNSTSKNGCIPILPLRSAPAGRFAMPNPLFRDKGLRTAQRP
jgi:hypothetical protein